MISIAMLAAALALGVYITHNPIKPRPTKPLPGRKAMAGTARGPMPTWRKQRPAQGAGLAASRR